MDIERKGGNCVVISHSKKYSFVVDPNLSQYGLKDQAADVAAQFATQPEFVAKGNSGVVINGPGEYEVHNCSILGVAAQSYRSDDGSKKLATMYSIDLGECRMAVVGHVKPKMSEEQLEALGVIDILVVPVGGFGYTLDPKEAVEVVRQIGPKAIIPTHYSEEGVTYEVPAAPLEDFIKELGAQHEVIAKLKLKAGAMPEQLTVYELTRSK